MKPYVILIRGINVGGKSKVPMAELREHLAASGYSDVSTYIASGNVILSSDKDPAAIRDDFEALLQEKFSLDNNTNKVLVLDHDQLQRVVAKKPRGFGEQPDIYYSDVIFLIDVTPDEAITVFKPREGVDAVWKGDEVIYSQRLGAQRTRSRLSAIIATPVYKSMTIRTFATTTKLLALLEEQL